MTIRVDHNIYVAFVLVSAVVGIYLSGYWLQKLLARIVKLFGRAYGSRISSQEYKLQRFVFQHNKSIIAKLYRWVNNQIIALGLKRQGITPLGFTLFWGFVALAVALLSGWLLNLAFFFTGFMWLVLWVCMMIMTRVLVSGRLEKRELNVMDAIDLIVPELHNGVKNAIVSYQDNFPKEVREDFKAFISNIQERGFTFEAAMYVLSDNLGEVFQDFAEKAIYYEKVGEKDLLDIFSDIVETNRLRRQLREQNSKRFRELTVTFAVSSLMVFGYFMFLLWTDEFSRNFLLGETAGNVILLIICIIVFGVLAYITSIKSRKI